MDGPGAESDGSMEAMMRQRAVNLVCSSTVMAYAVSQLTGTARLG